MDDTLETHDIRKGDFAVCAHVSVRPYELAAYFAPRVSRAGVFQPRGDKGGELIAESLDRDPWVTPTPDATKLLRVMHVERGGVVVREFPTDTIPDAARAERLEALRARLDSIDADEITDSTARFKVERLIYELENAPADEWAGFDLVTM